MTIRPDRWARRHWKTLAGLVVLAVVFVNVLAARHARAFLTYAPAGGATPQPEALSAGRKLGVLLNGVSVPRPSNTNDPGSLGLPFTTHRIERADEWLEAWHVPADDDTRGVVLLFPGYATAKHSLIADAAAFRQLGFDTLLIDFRGAGGSSGHDVTLGVREADDVAAAVRFATDRWPGRPVVLFGRSMGAVAVIRAVGRLGVNPTAVVLECPFDRMLNTVRNRFGAMGVPSFPGAELLVFWAAATSVSTAFPTTRRTTPGPSAVPLWSSLVPATRGPRRRRSGPCTTPFRGRSGGTCSTTPGTSRSAPAIPAGGTPR